MDGRAGLKYVFTAKFGTMHRHNSMVTTIDNKISQIKVFYLLTEYNALRNKNHNKINDTTIYLATYMTKLLQMDKDLNHMSTNRSHETHAFAIDQNH